MKLKLAVAISVSLMVLISAVYFFAFREQTLTYPLPPLSGERKEELSQKANAGDLESARILFMNDMRNNDLLSARKWHEFGLSKNARWATKETSTYLDELIAEDSRY